MTNSTKAHLQTVVDFIFRWWPRTEPPLSCFQKAQVVAHRGVHDNVVISENTMEAFHLAQMLGVWAIEMDVRWTQDLVPIVFHDADARRVFGQDLKISELSLSELRKRLPLVPTLKDVVGAFGGKVHLMIEIKDAPFPDLESQRSSLLEALHPFQAQKDFHILSLYPHLFIDAFPLFPPAACLLVAETNVTSLVKIVKEKGYAGLAGHYLLMNNQTVRDLLEHGFQVGCGFISSENSLRRELNRGVPWIFTNNANLIMRLIGKRMRGSH